ncbi:dTDP-4-amino-4,6-dideoxygalactose transaminase [Algoriphagus chordae]|uniref:dTDP-4-amino-4,6-dideoxygalactose transaminase n=1 Tax=Algoriphagus chordae TaxID=237019 RepID=A0A2W7QHT7_9BACT|nr:dTDP-4-amino-4,6-dideoxygalactose transaminase [Algoriphagus chordae]PZX47651.1 dTDP-4-amino-4,6-dideoxygalactose transaminase [Algoriphagus chordae]
MKIPFNKPYLSGKELRYIEEAVRLGKISGNGEFTQRCQSFFEKRYGFKKCLLTNSCTDALEMAALLCDIQAGDEVIMPSFTFVSTANAFVLRGAKIVFVDSRSDHPNMDESLIEELISPKTKAIIVVHYAGVACEMDKIMSIATKHKLWVIEDAAQGIESYYKEKALGSMGHLSCFSFHETKNIQSGEGGLLAINDPALIRRAEILWEKGTDRAAFFRGEVAKYGWVDIGSSFLPSELTAAFLWAQLEELESIQSRRMSTWEAYFQLFSEGSTANEILSSSYQKILIEASKNIEFTWQCREHKGNAHMFYLLFKQESDRTKFSGRMKSAGVLSVFHYQSLHKSDYAKKCFPNQYDRQLPNSDRYSDCLLRLPLFYELPEVSAEY